MCDCDCGNNENGVVISLDGAPEELANLINAVAKVAVDYPLAVSGNKKRSTEARKALMDVKNLASDMRKMALEKCKSAREKNDG